MHPVLPAAHSISATAHHQSLHIYIEKAGKAFLLGASGEQVYSIVLKERMSELCLDWLEDGLYSLRIESGSNVYVRQLEQQAHLLFLK